MQASQTGTDDNNFESPEDYLDFMRNPHRIIRLEWRKVRRTESKGMTSHSWLEARQMDGKRLRLEIYSDRGYTETMYDPAAPQQQTRIRFFDPESQIYEGRVADSQELNKPLTANGLRKIAQTAANARPYSLSEFNCHHFVLQVWNAVVIEVLKATHYPDRAKTGFLWGLEGTLGTWLEGIGNSLAAPNEQQLAAAGTKSSTKTDLMQKNRSNEFDINGSHGLTQGIARNSPNYDRARRLEHFSMALTCGSIHLLDEAGLLVSTGFPPKAQSPVATNTCELQCEAWANACIPGAGYAAIRLAERMNTLDVDKIVAEIFKPRESCAIGGQDQSPFAAFGSLSSFASFSPSIGRDGEFGEQTFSRNPLADACFVALRGPVELRLAIYAVLRPVAAPEACAWRLRLFSGDASIGEEGNFTYLLSDLPERTSATTSSVDIAQDEVAALQAALCSNDWSFFTHQARWAKN